MATMVREQGIRDGVGGLLSNNATECLHSKYSIKCFPESTPVEFAETLVGSGWVDFFFCMWCFFREELQQLVEMQRH